MACNGQTSKMLLKDNDTHCLSVFSTDSNCLEAISNQSRQGWEAEVRQISEPQGRQGTKRAGTTKWVVCKDRRASDRSYKPLISQRTTEHGSSGHRNRDAGKTRIYRGRGQKTADGSSHRRLEQTGHGQGT
ncbi:hypothetical protein O6H91_12G036600 [Diphasiastrum complanatum]|uniref:Uncharacterized protein n=1 Tax=Diphasiastrum complanatum TaxID=34168 RepID=A0ACC2C126_DIPCM|nr:hypothetical protein O6H91_12G036600 [Diphasiastrum complanatum]